MITVSPLETFCPTLASTLNTLPAAPASTLIPPAAPAAFGAAAGAFGAGTAGAAPVPFSSTVTSYTLPLTVIV